MALHQKWKYRIVQSGCCRWTGACEASGSWNTCRIAAMGGSFGLFFSTNVTVLKRALSPSCRWRFCSLHPHFHPDILLATGGVLPALIRGPLHPKETLIWQSLRMTNVTESSRQRPANAPDFPQSLCSVGGAVRSPAWPTTED